MTALILRADARALPLPDATVDLIVTSPPYYALRSYTDGGQHYHGQIGSEPTPAEYIATLVDCTREMMRVLKPAGSLWVNLGDKYAGSPSGPRETLNPKARVIWTSRRSTTVDVPSKSLVHLVRQPRYYSAVDEIREPHAGEFLSSGARNARHGKTGGRLPNEANGRASTSTPDRWSVATDIHPLGKLPGSVWTIPTEPLQVPDHLGVDHFAAFPTEWPRRIILGWSPRAVCKECGFLLGSTYDSGMLGVRNEVQASHSARSTREVLLQGMREPAHRTQQEDDHLSASHDSRVRRSVEAGSPDGAEEWLPDGAPTRDGRATGSHPAAVGGRAPQERDQNGQPHRELGAAGQGRARPAPETRTQAVPVPALRRHAANLRDILACPHCGSSALRPSRVADPFGGTGTTALVAHTLGRVGISVDRSADYNRIATWRTTNPGQIAHAMRVPKPEPVADTQLTLDLGGVT